MATIRQRGEKYQAQICCAGHRLSKTFSTLREAKRWAVTKEAELSEGYSPGSRSPVADFFDDYCKFYESRVKKPRHALFVFGYLRRDPLSELPIFSVTPKDIEAWIERRRTIPSEATGKIVTESTIRRQLDMLSGFFRWAVDKELIKENPCHSVRRPDNSGLRERVASPQEIEQLKIAAGWEEGTVPRTVTARVCAAFVFACCTGMRSGEIVRIEKGWIRGNTLWIPLEATKTERFRKIALSKRALAILDDVMAMGFSPAIWGVEDAQRDALFRKIRDRAGLGEVRDSEGRLIEAALHFHDSRATFCTWAASPGPDGAPRLDVMSLARQTGHANVKMLMRYYRPSVGSFADRLDM